MVLRLTPFSMFVLTALYLLSQGGCTRQPSAVVAPHINADAAGKMALEMYDADKNGKISGAEFDKAPSLKDALPQFNSTVEKGITAADISARIIFWQETKVGGIGTTCLVTRGGKPLVGAEVKFVPEKFLGEYVPICTGQTEQDGSATISRPVSGPDDFIGVPPGFYKVEITKSGENIPAKFNTQTIFGVEIAPNVRRTSGLVFEIK